MNSQFRVDGDAYDDFMGRYSTVLATLFADFADVRSGMRVLDVGAGTGALTAELLSRGASVAAADPSPEFVDVLRTRFPDFVRAYEPDGLTPAEFDTFAPTVRTLRAFIGSYHDLLHQVTDAMLANPDQRSAT